jgi:hypothetical protein
LLLRVASSRDTIDHSTYNTWSTAGWAYADAADKYTYYTALQQKRNQWLCIAGCIMPQRCHFDESLRVWMAQQAELHALEAGTCKVSVLHPYQHAKHV